MRVAVLSDIHGHLVALEAVARDIERQNPDLVIHGGDLAVIGPRPAEVLEFVRAAGWPGVLGNTDQILFDRASRPVQEARAPRLLSWLKVLFDDLTPWAYERLSADQISWLKHLPMQWRSDGAVLVHASPNDLWRGPMPDATDTELGDLFGPTQARLALYGHIHRPYVRRLASLTVANTGSVGLPYDGDPRASYVLISDGVPEVRRVDYDLGMAAHDARASGFPLPDWLSEVQQQARFRSP